MSQPVLNPDVLDFLNWNPPPVVIGAHASRSTTRRPPAFYDKHLANGLILRYVRHMPNLPLDLGALARTRIAPIQAELPSLGRLTGTRSDDMWMSNAPITDKAGVAEQFQTNVLRSTGLASALLHPAIPQWASVLHWTRSPPRPDCHAIADAYLNLQLPTGDSRFLAECWNVIDSALQAKLRRLDNLGMSTQMTAEHKSPLAGSWQVMTSISGLAIGPEVSHSAPPFFQWSTCVNRGCSNHTPITLKSGADACSPPWTIPEPTWSPDLSDSQTSSSQSLWSQSTQSTQQDLSGAYSEALPSPRAEEDGTYTNTEELTAEHLLQQVI
jgi:hypothetical protein